MAWLRDRMAVAFVTAIVAALTLFAWLLILLLIVEARLQVQKPVLSLLLSNIGLTVIGLAGVAGFVLGGARMAEIFSLVWGTHPVWSRLGSWLRAKVELLNDAEPVSLPVVLAVLAAVLAGSWIFFR